MIKVLPGFPEEDILQLIFSFRRNRYPKSYKILQKGERPRLSLIVLSGYIKVKILI